MKWFGKIVAVICIFIAIYNFDLHSFNRSIAAILLFMQAIFLVSRDEKLNRFLQNSSIALAIFLILKILITG